MVAVVGAGSGSGNGGRRSERYAAVFIAVLAGRPVAFIRQRLAQVGGTGGVTRPFSFLASDFKTRPLRCKDERRSFSLLPTQVLAGGEVERGVHNGIRSGIAVVLRMKLRQGHIVGVIEFREPVGMALALPRSTQIAPN